MRKLFVTGMGSLILAASAATAQAQAGAKIAFVNSQQLFQVVPGRAEAAAAYDKVQASAQEQAKAMQDTITKLQDAYTKEKEAIPQAEKLKVWKDKENVFQERMQKLQATVEDRQNELQQPLMELIQRALEDYRQEMGYTVILDLASGQGIAAIDKNMDVTDKVAARIAKLPAPKVTAEGGAASPAAKKPATTGPAVNPVGAKKPPVPPTK